MKQLLDKIVHSAWEPLTPRGVIALLSARPWRLFLMQAIVAFIAAGTVAWFVQTAWFPVITDAIGKLPDDSGIRREKLVWRGDSPTQLAAGHFLSLGVDFFHEGSLGNESHITVQLTDTNAVCRTIFGYQTFDYPPGWQVSLTQKELAPMWAAWRPLLLTLVFFGTAVGLFTSWLLLGALYAPLTLLYAFFLNKQLNLQGAWRLALAALLPGALFMTLDIAVYGLSGTDVVGLSFGYAFHFIIGWVYIIMSVLLLPTHPEVERETKNPFQG